MELDLSGLSPEYRTELEARIKKHSVERENGCIEWVKTINTNGYGQVSVSSKMQSAHRVVFALHHGKIPNGLVVMHVCDNPLCVNPVHLLLGTHTDNMQDCKAKGRNSKGEKNGRCKLTEFDVQRIRVSTLSTADLAEVHGVSEWMICSIKARRAWKHIL